MMIHRQSFLPFHWSSAQWRHFLVEELDKKHAPLENEVFGPSQEMEGGASPREGYPRLARLSLVPPCRRQGHQGER
jgi:hypothetical protein